MYWVRCTVLMKLLRCGSPVFCTHPPGGWASPVGFWFQRNSPPSGPKLSRVGSLATLSRLMSFAPGQRAACALAKLHRTRQKHITRWEHQLLLIPSHLLLVFMSTFSDTLIQLMLAILPVATQQLLPRSPQANFPKHVYTTSARMSREREMIEYVRSHTNGDERYKHHAHRKRRTFPTLTPVFPDFARHPHINYNRLGTLVVGNILCQVHFRDR